MAAPRTPGARKVHRVPLVELDSGFLRPLHRQQAPAPAAAVPPRVPANAAPQAPEPLPSPALLFEMEGLEEALPAQEPVTDSARRTLETVARLLAPGDHTVNSAAQLAFAASGADVAHAASLLARLLPGWTIQLVTSAGGSLRQLKHTFITAANHATSSEPLLICPSFAEAFATSPPTPRYAAVLSAVPPLLVAPLPRVVRGTLLLGAELARCFERQDRSLPPWRHTDALLTRYDAATSLTVRPDGVLAAAAAAPAAPAVAARRQQQRESQQLARVQLRLQQWGVPAAAVDGSPEAPGTPSSPASPSSAAAEGDSPKSVVQGALSRAFSSGDYLHERAGWPVAGFGPV